jgi:hypothetical protein
MPEEVQTRRPKPRAQKPQVRLDPPRHNVFAEPSTKGRIDPPVQHVDAVSPWALLENRDPTRHYVYANASQAQVGGVQWYKMLGYRVERLEPGGVQPRGGATCEVGELITVMGNTLMSCTLERKAELDNYGYDGQSGQRAVGEIERQIVDPDDGIDASRGLYGKHGPYYSVFNETKPLEGES